MTDRPPEDQAVHDPPRCPRCGVPVPPENHPAQVCTGPPDEDT